MSIAISIERNPQPRARPRDEDLMFGRIFTNHMLLMDWDESAGWRDARIVPFGPIAFSPAAAGLHYGQSLFEGLKAFRGADGRCRIFRLDRHCARMAEGAARLCMPGLPPEMLSEL